MVISAYRSHNYQQNLINQFGDGNLRALPGHSEHQLGLAIDIMGLSNAHMEGDGDASRIYQRLVGHGHEYGRHNSYQNGLTVDGYYVEKRHRRYLGVPFATLLKTKNQTLTQYFYQMIRPIDTHGYIHTNPTHIFQSRITPTPIYRPSQPDTTPPRDNPSNESVDRSNELFTKPL
ncbi:MAG: D-alanyl-D-alanine carboxypeptidase family protein [Candidatus Peribacteria bacterium]|nr:MAG: D-alanyl-D-alanine carboxypeptidase family protein [Candidatus Peribacteria bacterium]